MSCIVLFFPQVLAYSFSILDFDNSRHLKIKIMQESVPKIIYIIYIYSFDYLKYFLPVYLILKIELIKNNIYLKKILLLFVVVLLFLLSSSTLADTIFSILAIIIIIINLYIKHKKIFYVLMFLFVGSLSCLLLLNKGSFMLREINIFNYISLISQAYFGGPMNIAAAMSIDKELLNLNILKVDFFKNFFILSPLFKGEISTVELFNYTLYKSFNRVDQIIPMIGQAYFYVGFILSPLLIYPIIKISIFFEKMAKRSMNLYSKFLFLSLTVFLSVSPILYNFNIVLSKLFVLSPLILVSFKIKKRVKDA